MTTTMRRTMRTMTIMLVLCGGFVIANPLSGEPAVYDQRQTGDLNVQVGLKNVQVVALLNSEVLEDYTDYDYFYDYADFTIKPSNRPTSSSTTASTEKTSVTPIAEPASLQNSTVSAPPVNSTNSIDAEETPAVDPSNGTVNSTSNADDDKSQPNEENEPGSTDTASSTLAFSAPPVTMAPTQSLRSRKRCKSGYIPTGNGRCRRANRRWLSLLPTTMTTVRVTFILGVAILTLLEAGAAPTRRYDQRQEGEFNVHAQLENLLFVVALPSGNNDLLSEVALQALELKQYLAGGIIPQTASKDPESDPTGFNEPNDEASRGEEVYITTGSTAETVETSEDHPDGKGQEVSEKEASTSPGERQKVTTPAAKRARSFELAKAREIPVILGYLVDTRAVDSKVENAGRGRNVVGHVWNPAGRPGASLKLGRGLDEERVALSPAAKDGTVVGSKLRQELRLLGDGIENCGPGRRRDASGVCEFDEAADSLL